MRRLMVASLVAVLAAYPAIAQSIAESPQYGASTQADDSARDRALARAEAGMATGDKQQAPADAEQAARDGVYGLIDTGEFNVEPTSVVCFTPGRQSPLTLTTYGHSDFITPDVGARLSYAAAYNRALVEQPDYPYRDLCRVRTDEDSKIEYFEQLVAKPARAVSRPPLDLFEAARRGSADDIRRFLQRASVNDLDGVGMSALAWAVARDNRPAIDALLAAGANPWLGGRTEYHNNDEGAVFWAARLGRADLFALVADRHGRPFDSWPVRYISAALDGGNQSVFARMLAEPHEKIRIDLLALPLPDASLLGQVLIAQPELADTLLFKAIHFSDLRPDLVRLALAHGANPNAVRTHVSPLAEVAKGIEPHSVEIVDMLLKAGADPNLASHRTRPVWEAVRMLKLDGRVDEFDVRANANFHRLIAAGANLKLPNWQGVPPIWFLMFPYSSDHTKLDASFITPELLEMLVQNGMDVNAEWNGKRALGPVEAQAGHDSELAQTLRKLGAKP